MVTSTSAPATSPAHAETLRSLPDRLMRGKIDALDDLRDVPLDAVVDHAETPVAGLPDPERLALLHLARRLSRRGLDAPTLELAIACRLVLEKPRRYFPDLLVESGRAWAIGSPHRGVAMVDRVLGHLVDDRYSRSWQAHALASIEATLARCRAVVGGFAPAQSSAQVTYESELPGLPPGFAQNRVIMRQRYAELAFVTGNLVEAFRLLDDPRVPNSLSGGATQLSKKVLATRRLSWSLDKARVLLALGDGPRACEVLAESSRHLAESDVRASAVELDIAGLTLAAQVLAHRSGDGESPHASPALRRIEHHLETAATPTTWHGAVTWARLQRLVGLVLQPIDPERASVYASRAATTLYGLDCPWQGLACVADLPLSASAPSMRERLRRGVRESLGQLTIRRALAQAMHARAKHLPPKDAGRQRLLDTARRLPRLAGHDVLFEASAS
ncbi:MAG: hypothetical protein AAF772_13520 [Acidobacteriota bacterium]